MAAIDGPDQILAQVDDPVVAERRHHLTGRRVETEQAVPARQEDAQVLAVPPHRHPAVTEAAAERRHAVGVGPGVEDPLDGAGGGVQRGDAVVVRAHIHRVVDHERRAGEVPGHGAEFLPRPVRGTPRPDRLQLAHVRRRQRLGRREPAVRAVPPDIRPFHQSHRRRSRRGWPPAAAAGSSASAAPSSQISSPTCRRCADDSRRACASVRVWCASHIGPTTRRRAATARRKSAV